MIARKYNSYIGIIEVFNQPDGFGGNIFYDYGSFFNRWANVKTKNVSFVSEIGKKQNITEVTFTLRKKDINFNLNINSAFIFYNFEVYNIITILNIDLDNVDIEIVASKRI